jgi:hypothetical protein
MAFHRCNATLVIGSEDIDEVYQEGRAYDDGDERVAAAIARFPEHFDSPHKAAAK